MNKPAILILGQTRVGKSSIINYVLQKQVAETCSYKPKTKGIIAYEGESFYIYDTEGYEVAKTEKFEANINEWLSKIKPACIWYVISAAGVRVSEYDEKILNTLISNHKTALVFSKVDEVSAKQLKDLIDCLPQKLRKNLPIFKFNNVDIKRERFLFLKKILPKSVYEHFFVRYAYDNKNDINLIVLNALLEFSCF
jgi:small GTP-binding protein